MRIAFSFLAVILLAALSSAVFNAKAQQDRSLQKQDCTASSRFEVFPTKSETDIPYRIPAIAALPDGTVICVADYRHSRNDIGIKKDGRVDFLLQSAPAGPGRANVGIYYKALEKPGDYASVESVAKDWEGVCRITDKGSAYSTMAVQSDGSIGFLYEEQTHCTTAGGGYTIVYKRLTIEDITGGAYR